MRQGTPRMRLPSWMSPTSCSRMARHTTSSPQVTHGADSMPCHTPPPCDSRYRMHTACLMHAWGRGGPHTCRSHATYQNTRMCHMGSYMSAACPGRAWPVTLCADSMPCDTCCNEPTLSHALSDPIVHAWARGGPHTCTGCIDICACAAWAHACPPHAPASACPTPAQPGI